MYLKPFPEHIPEDSALFAAVRDGIHEAGNPYFDYLFGDADRAKNTLKTWLRRTSSEVSMRRIILAVNGDCEVGGYIALSGKELAACRRADGIAAVLAAPSSERLPLQDRMQKIGGLFELPEPDELYLSKIWVQPDLRGAGHGAEILRSFLQQGEAAGCRKFRLDVAFEKARVVAMYESAGFRVCTEKSCVAGLRYLGMIRDV